MRHLDRTYGVELECVAPTGITRQAIAARITAAGIDCRPEEYAQAHVTRSWWKVVTDGSLSNNQGQRFDYERCMEVVSPPLKGEDGFATISKVCAILQAAGFSVNKTCGMHVHVDARRPRELSIHAIKRLAMEYREFEVIIDTIMSPSRRGPNAGNGFTCGLLGSPEQIMACEDAAQIANVLRGRRRDAAPEGRANSDPRRYVKLNLVPIWSRGTVEFRHHSGTIMGDKVNMWVLACLRWVDSVENSATSVVAAQVRRTMTSVRRGTKMETLLNMLQRPEGCTVAEVLTATGWREVSVAGNAHRYGLEVRQQRERNPATGRSEVRYFGQPRAMHTPTEQPTTSVQLPAATNFPRSLEGWMNKLGMTAAEQAHWRERAAVFAVPAMQLNEPTA